MNVRPHPALADVRRICLALPEVTERLSHGSPAFFIRGKKTLAMYVDDHHGDGRVAIWCPAPAGVQAQLVEQEPERFFRPPYVGPSGWIGVRLDIDPDWDEVAEICADAYRHVGPKRLAAEVDAAFAPRPAPLAPPAGQERRSRRSSSPEARTAVPSSSPVASDAPDSVSTRPTSPVTARSDGGAGR